MELPSHHTSTSIDRDKGNTSHNSTQSIGQPPLNQHQPSLNQHEPPFNQHQLLLDQQRFRLNDRNATNELDTFNVNKQQLAQQQSTHQSIQQQLAQQASQQQQQQQQQLAQLAQQQHYEKLIKQQQQAQLKMNQQDKVQKQSEQQSSSNQSQQSIRQIQQLMQLQQQQQQIQAKFNQTQTLKGNLGNQFKYPGSESIQQNGSHSRDTQEITGSNNQVYSNSSDKPKLHPLLLSNPNLLLFLKSVPQLMDLVSKNLSLLMDSEFISKVMQFYQVQKRKVEVAAAATANSTQSMFPSIGNSQSKHHPHSKSHLNYSPSQNSMNPLSQNGNNLQYHQILRQNQTQIQSQFNTASSRNLRSPLNNQQEMQERNQNLYPQLQKQTHSELLSRQSSQNIQSNQLHRTNSVSVNQNTVLSNIHAALRQRLSSNDLVYTNPSFNHNAQSSHVQSTNQFKSPPVSQVETAFDAQSQALLSLINENIKNTQNGRFNNDLANQTQKSPSLDKVSKSINSADLNVNKEEKKSKEFLIFHDDPSLVTNLHEAREFAYFEYLYVEAQREKRYIKDHQALIQQRLVKNSIAKQCIMHPQFKLPVLTKNTHNFQFSELQMQSTGDMDECLAPIRIDLDHDGYKIKETFLWNVHDNLISVELFTHGIFNDLQVPLDVKSILFPIAVKLIRDQVSDFLTFGGKLLFTTQNGQGLEGNVVQERRMTRELRICIKLDITIGSISLLDQFEWDMDSKLNNPEVFAIQLTQDLQLPRTFESAIAHQIREQLFVMSKSLVLLDYPLDNLYLDQPIIENNDLAKCFLPQVSNSDHTKSSVIRSNTQEKFKNGPTIIQLDSGELDKLEKARDRDARRMRRQTHKVQKFAALPERDTIKTAPTPLPRPFHYQEFIEKDLVVLIEDKVAVYYFDPTSESNTIRKEMLEPIVIEVKETFIQSEFTQLIPHKGNEDHVFWKCLNCDCKSNDTPLIRLDTAGSLCDQCGIYQSKFKEPRPLDYPAFIPSSKDLKSNIPLPSWMMLAADHLHVKYAEDQFSFTFKKKEWKIQCNECHAKLYASGPHHTLDNYDIHMKSKTHRANVSIRLKRTLKEK